MNVFNKKNTQLLSEITKVNEQNQQAKEQINAFSAQSVAQNNEIEKQARSNKRPRQDRSFSENRATDSRTTNDTLLSMIKNALAPIQRDFANIHDRLDIIQYPQNSETLQPPNIIQNRGRSISKPNNRERAQSAAKPPKVNKVLQSKTFAEIVSSSKTKKESIRNIRITAEDPDDAARVSKHLANSYACQDIANTSITNKTNNFLTVKCSNPDEAAKMKNTLKIYYGTK